MSDNRNVPVQERGEAIQNLLSQIWFLDKNGRCICTDGTLDDLSDAELIEQLLGTIATIREDEQAQ